MDRIGRHTTLELLQTDQWKNAFQDVEQMFVVKAFCTIIRVLSVDFLLASVLPHIEHQLVMPLEHTITTFPPALSVRT